MFRKTITVDESNIIIMKNDIKTIKDSFDCYKKDHYKWQKDVSERLSICPAEERLRAKEAEQNGKLDRLGVTTNRLAVQVSSVASNVKLWCYVFAGVITLASVLLGYVVNKKHSDVTIDDVVIVKELEEIKSMIQYKGCTQGE